MPSRGPTAGAHDLAIEAVTSRRSRQPLRSVFRTALREITELEAVTAEVHWSDGSWVRVEG